MFAWWAIRDGLQLFFLFSTHEIPNTAMIKTMRLLSLGWSYILLVVMLIVPRQVISHLVACGIQYAVINLDNFHLLHTAMFPGASRSGIPTCLKPAYALPKPHFASTSASARPPPAGVRQHFKWRSSQPGGFGGAASSPASLMSHQLGAMIDISPLVTSALASSGNVRSQQMRSPALPNAAPKTSRGSRHAGIRYPLRVP